MRGFASTEISSSTGERINHENLLLIKTHYITHKAPRQHKALQLTLPQSLTKTKMAAVTSPPPHLHYNPCHFVLVTSFEAEDYLLLLIIHYLKF